MNATSLSLLDRLKNAGPDSAVWQRLQLKALVTATNPDDVRRFWVPGSP